MAAIQAEDGAGYVHPQGAEAYAGSAEIGGEAGMSVFDYKGPRVEPKPYKAPRCPVCGEETDTLYKNIYGETVGCDVCIRTVDAWEEKK